MQQRYNKRLEQTKDRVTYLYRTKYKRQVRNEGYRGVEQYTEGMRRAYLEVTRETGLYTATPAKDVGSNKELLMLLPKETTNAKTS